MSQATLLSCRSMHDFVSRQEANTGPVARQGGQSWLLCKAGGQRPIRRRRTVPLTELCQGAGVDADWPLTRARLDAQVCRVDAPRDEE
eukprot:352986-Chlamydomonas_euryale.AAC.6